MASLASSPADTNADVRNQAHMRLRVGGGILAVVLLVEALGTLTGTIGFCRHHASRVGLSAAIPTVRF